MKAGLFSQLKLFLAYGVKAELSDRERLLSPLLFAATMLVLFSFALGEGGEFGLKIFVAETFLTAFLAVQICFSRIFEPDNNDRVFDLIRTYPVSAEAWFLGKYILVVLLGLLIVVPATVLAAFLNDSGGVEFLCPAMFLLLFLVVAGLASLGVLLSAMTLKSNSRQILFPLIYYPLTAPVLLAAVQAASAYLQVGEFNADVMSWGGILVGFGVIYFTLGFLLFGELVNDG